MERLSQLDNMTQSDIAQFQRVCRKLLKMTFIVREKNEEHRKDYNFIKNNSKLFTEYLNIIGYDVKYDIDSGVARLINLASAGEEGSIQSNRKRLKLYDSIVLSALWLIYEERMIKGDLKKSIIIQKADLDNQLERLGAKNRIDKGKMKAILEMFRDYNLLEIIGEIGEPDCELKLYSSMQFCLSKQAFKQLAESTAAKIRITPKISDDESGFVLDEEGEANE